MTKISFRKDTLPIIDEILKKNKIEESNETFLKKLSEKKPFQGEIIFTVVEKIIDKAPKEEIIIFLEEGLNITLETAKNVYDDIVAGLLPIAKKQNLADAPEKETPEKIPKRIKKQPIIEEQNTLNSSQQSSGPDKYREPVG